MKSLAAANRQFLAVIMSVSDDHLSNYPGAMGAGGPGGEPQLSQ